MESKAGSRSHDFSSLTRKNHRASHRVDEVPRTQRISTKTWGDRIVDIIIGVIIVLIVLAIIYPLYFIVIASFSDPTQVATGKVFLLPRSINLKGYAQILADQRIWTGYKNTLLYSAMRICNVKEGIQTTKNHHVLLHIYYVLLWWFSSELLVDETAGFAQFNVGIHYSWGFQRFQYDYRSILLRSVYTRRTL